ncbi:MAG: hypothetical protein P8I25_05000 [Ilumatobacter sp.]|nr:hypothetical protein [Ilumatobacter sp.]
MHRHTDHWPDWNKVWSSRALAQVVIGTSPTGEQYGLPLATLSDSIEAHLAARGHAARN